MRTLLFVDYWSLHEPLTQATVLPTLRMVMAEGLADRVVLVTVERGMRAVDQAGQLAEGIAHVPFVATTGLPRSWHAVGICFAWWDALHGSQRRSRPVLSWPAEWWPVAFRILLPPGPA